MSGENNHSFKGYILAYKDAELIGRYAGCYAAAKQLGVSPSSVCKSINQQCFLSKLGYQFFREPINLITSN
jgi:hypothetical protein